MPINLIQLNGSSKLIDYDELEASLREFLGPKCSEATMYVFNNFPAPVSSECKIDILILLSLFDIQGNYTRHPNETGGLEYFRNVIVPITVNNQFRESVIKIAGNFLEIDDYEYENSEELNSLKFGLLNFLAGNCEMDRNKLFLQPIELLLNNQSSEVFGKHIVNKSFNGKQFFSILKKDPKQFFRPYQPWNKNTGYDVFKEDAGQINEIASRFTEFGYLTKRKIERIEAQLIRNSAMFESIGMQPTIIVGKAGTGKTAHLLHLLVRCLVNDKNVTFLTYNHLLTKDITYQVRMAQNGLYRKWESDGKDTSGFAFSTVQTLMGFMFRLSRSLGVLHLMTEKRINELKIVLQKSLQKLEIGLPGLFQQYSERIFHSTINWNAAIEAIQNSKWDVSTKQYGIALLKFLRKNNKSITHNLDTSTKEFYEYKVGQLEEMNHKKVFLQDYTGCLKNTLDLIRDAESYYKQFDVATKYDLLDVLMNLGGRKPDKALKDHIISLALFTSRVRNVLRGRLTKGRILMVDEAQDCHSYEREIFYEMFTPEKVLLSYGGKEQLIRFSDTCKWEIFKGKSINVKKIPSGNKSYRIKQRLLDLCNFIADRHKIDLKLQSFSEEDTGQLIFDFRPLKQQSLGLTFSKLLERGAVNGCKPMEALMVMDVNSPEYEGNNVHSPVIENVVNEHDVMEDTTAAIYKDFNYLNELGQFSEYWVGAVADKQKIGFPSPNEVRIINYESCRGLEAWCIMCLNIDKFYTSQVKSDDAEKYLLHEDLFLTKDQRAAMFAITWILMAATRAIDTLFLQMSDKDNEFVKLCMEYAKTNSSKCLVRGL